MAINATVQASFSINEKHRVDIVLDSVTGDVLHSKCACKSGAMGKCKHTVATLYQVIDYKDSGATSIPDAQSCTQETRKWGIGTKTFSVREKFADLVFVHHQPGKDSAKSINQSMKRKNYTAVPPSCTELSQDRVRNLAANFKRGKQSMWGAILEESLMEVNMVVYPHVRGVSMFSV